MLVICRWLYRISVIMVVCPIASIIYAQTTPVNGNLAVTGNTTVGGKFAAGSTVIPSFGGQPYFSVIDPDTGLGTTFNVFKSSKKGTNVIYVGSPGENGFTFVKTEQGITKDSNRTMWKLVSSSVNDTLKFLSAGGGRLTMSITQMGDVGIGRQGPKFPFDLRRLNNEVYAPILANFSHDVSVTLPSYSGVASRINLMMRKIDSTGNSTDSSQVNIDGFVDGSFGNAGIKLITQNNRTLTEAVIINADGKTTIKNKLVIGPKSGNNIGLSGHPTRDTANPIMNISPKDTLTGSAIVRFDAPQGRYSGFDFSTYYHQNVSNMTNVNGIICRHYNNYSIDLNMQNAACRISLTNDGKIKMGTDTRTGLGFEIEMTTPQVAINGNLQVNGDLKIRNWTLRDNAPDYVFKDDYKLNKLENVEKFVKENHHLPEVPSAKKMAENGVDLLEMNMTLLKKVEELTLYVIDQQKQIKGQQSAIKGQQEEIDMLKKRIGK